MAVEAESVVAPKVTAAVPLITLLPAVMLSVRFPMLSVPNVCVMPGLPGVALFARIVPEPPTVEL